jgi:hypothetical protein
MKWLENDLASNNTGKTAILMTHHALNYRLGVQGKLNYVDNVDQVKGLLNKYGVHLAITGHIHITEVNRNGTLVNRSKPAVCSYPCSYTVYYLAVQELTINIVWYGNKTIVAVPRMSSSRPERMLSRQRELSLIEM